MLFLKILGGLAAVALGVWLGLAGQYRYDPDEVERSLEVGGRSHRAKRHFTPLGWLRKDQRRSHQRRRQASRHFNLSNPDQDKPDLKLLK